MKWTYTQKSAHSKKKFQITFLPLESLIKLLYTNSQENPLTHTDRNTTKAQLALLQETSFAWIISSTVGPDVGTTS